MVPAGKRCKRRPIGLMKFFRRVREKTKTTTATTAQVIVDPGTPERPVNFPGEIEVDNGSPKSLVSNLSEYSALGAATKIKNERDVSRIQGRSLRISDLPPILPVDELDQLNLLPMLSDAEDSIDKSFFGSSNRGTPVPSPQQNPNPSPRQIPAPSPHQMLVPSPQQVLVPSLQQMLVPSLQQSSVERKSFRSDRPFISLDDVQSTKRNFKFFADSKYLRKIIDDTFRKIDIDGSGGIDKKELYLGMVMIHLELAKYAGSSACQPASRQYAEEIFDAIDIDGSGYIEKHEFVDLMILLFSQVLTRVMVQWVMSIMLVPIVAHYLMTVISHIYQLVQSVCMDRYPIFFSKITELYLAQVFLLSHTPSFVQSGAYYLYWFLPDRNFLVATLLCTLFLPWLITKCDRFFVRKTTSRKNHLLGNIKNQTKKKR